MFLRGRSPYVHMGARNISLLLSASAEDVRTTLDAGHAAGQVLGSPAAGPGGVD